MNRKQSNGQGRDQSNQNGGDNQVPEEGRRFPRFQTDTLVWWNRDWEPEPIALLDISAGGMRCEFPSHIKKDEIIPMSFEIPGEEHMIYAECRIIHSAKGEGPFWNAGLEIVSVEGMERERFMDILKKPRMPKPKDYQKELEHLNDPD